MFDLIIWESLMTMSINTEALVFSAKCQKIILKPLSEFRILIFFSEFKRLLCFMLFGLSLSNKQIFPQFFFCFYWKTNIKYVSSNKRSKREKNKKPAVNERKMILPSSMFSAHQFVSLCFSESNKLLIKLPPMLWFVLMLRPNDSFFGGVHGNGFQM